MDPSSITTWRKTIHDLEPGFYHPVEPFRSSYNDVFITKMVNKIAQLVVYEEFSWDHKPLVAEVGSSLREVPVVSRRQHSETRENIDRQLQCIEEAIFRSAYQHPIR